MYLLVYEPFHLIYSLFILLKYTEFKKNAKN